MRSCLYICHVCKLTVFSRLYVQDVTADTVSRLCVGQDLNAVVGELFQTLQLHLLTSGGDVLHLAPFWATFKDNDSIEGLIDFFRI